MVLAGFHGFARPSANGQPLNSIDQGCSAPFPALRARSTVIVNGGRPTRSSA